MNSPDSNNTKGKEKSLKLEHVVEINVGLSWLEHLRHLAAMESHKSTFDLCELFDHVDIIVAGSNLTASIESEYIIPFFARVCTALNRLSDATEKKAIIEFQREPWDLVLCREEDNLFLSVMSIDNEMRIVCLDQAINFVSFADAVRRKAREILENIKACVGANQHPEISRLAESLRLAAKPVNVETKDERFNLAPNTLGVSVPGFSLSLLFEPTVSFFQYQPDIAFDLHSLLVPGELQFEFEDKAFSIGEHVFVTLFTLLKNCQEWIGLFSESRSFDHEIQSSFYLRLRSSAEAWEIGTANRERRDGNDRSLHQVDPRVLLESILSISMNFAKKLEVLNPAIIVNQRFSDFLELALDLEIFWEDLCEKDLFNDEPETFLEQFAGLSPDSAEKNSPDFRFDFAKLRAIHPAHQWSFQTSKISFSDIFTTDRRMIVPSGSGIVGLSLETGKVEWSNVFHGRTSPVFQRDSTFIQTRDTKLSVFDSFSGEEICRVKEERAVFSLDTYSEVSVFATEQGIVGRGKDTLEEEWFYPIKRKIGVDASAAGPVYIVLSNGGILHAINPITGDALWKVKVPGTIAGRPRIYRSRIFIALQSSHRFQLSSRLAFTGREAWTFEEEGVFSGELFFRGDECIFSIEKDGGIEIVGFCLKTHAVVWRIPMSSPRGYYPSFVFFKNRAIAKSSSAETVCFETASGRILWRTTSDPTPFAHANLGLVVVRDAFFSYNGRIEIRSLADGELMRGFGDTMIEAKYFNVFHPLSIITGERGDGIDEDRLVSFTIQHFLAMVELPDDP